MPRAPKDLVRHSAVLAAFWLFAIALLVTGCSSPFTVGLSDASPTDAGPTDAGPDACAPGQLTRDDGTCQPAGLPPDLPCPPGELLLDGGACQKAGVPPEACAVGFVPDGKDGCAPILPADSCPVGQMAVPGETVCHEVAPCGSGTWGDIPVEANTQFVDQAYAGGSNDGTQAHPWTTLQQGILWAKKGAIVAVAAGSYPEDVLILGKPVQLWGRCPALVEVAGTGAVEWTVQVRNGGASGTEIHGIAVTGPASGVGVLGASGVALEGVWIHDTGDIGLEFLDDLGPNGVALKGSLVEQSYAEGMRIVGSIATIEGTVVRSTLLDSNGLGGYGIDTLDDTTTKARANVTIRACLVEQNHGVGAVVTGSDATIEGTVVRSTLPDAQGDGGRGITIQSHPTTKARANVTVRACLIEQNQEVGVLVAASDATIEDTVVHGTLPGVSGQGEAGIFIEDDPQTKTRATVTVRACLVEQNYEKGMVVLSSDATIEGTVVRATVPDAKGMGGGGVIVKGNTATKTRANVTVRACLVEQNHEVGVFVEGSDATIEGTVVRATQSGAPGDDGEGIEIQNGSASRANATVRACLVEQNQEAGVLVAGSDATIEATVIRATLSDTHGLNGRGLGFEADPATKARAQGIVRACLIEQNQDTGLFVLDSDATIEASIVRETAPDSDGTFGDGISVEKGKVTMQNLEVARNARAGVGNFGGQVVITGGDLTCNSFDLEGETQDNLPFSFDGSTGWRCSRRVPAACTVLDDCHVETTALVAPAALPPVTPLP